jgi:hypothetical protein
MRLDTTGKPVHVGERRAAISAWFSETLDDTRVFDLAGAV